MFAKKLLLIILTSFCCTLAIQAQNGTGTSTDPYQISNVDDLKSFRDNVNNTSNYSTDAFFVLVADIDLSGETNWKPIGVTIANRFDGNFDGRGHVIKNLQIIGTAPNVGLFAYTGANAVIKNVGVETTPLGVNGGQNVGILVGNQRGSKISNCYVSGSVSGTDAGGLIGGQASVSGNSVDQCYAFVNVNSSGGNGAGGLIGVLRGQLTNSYVFGNMTASSSSNGMINVSGLVGVVSNNGIVENCYSTGNLLAISNDGRAGGVVGTISQSSASIKNNFAANA